MTKPRLNPVRRPETAVGEWLAAMMRGLDALEFLERSRDLAAETVAAAIDEPRLDTHHRGREDFPDPGSGPAV